MNTVDYNTERPSLAMPEYGRMVQQMVDYAKTIADAEEREKCARSIVAIMEIIAVLIGQGLDAPIKAFTDTADWTFSQQIPPPPKEYEGHYLCTVAAGGHRKVVKPIRFGRRRGAVIVVNRQLCIANAFEESIAEKFPRFHKWIRHIYDTYGYPLSNIITTKARADVTYILMKPLEWIFLIYLYLTDSRPEIRINRQYRL